MNTASQVTVRRKGADFMAGKINATPTGDLSFVDVRDVAAAFRAAMKDGKPGERYLLGSAAGRRLKPGQGAYIRLGL